MRVRAACDPMGLLMAIQRRGSRWKPWENEVLRVIAHRSTLRRQGSQGVKHDS